MNDITYLWRLIFLFSSEDGHCLWCSSQDIHQIRIWSHLVNIVPRYRLCSSRIYLDTCQYEKYMLIGFWIVKIIQYSNYTYIYLNISIFINLIYLSPLANCFLYIKLPPSNTYLGPGGMRHGSFVVSFQVLSAKSDFFVVSIRFVAGLNSEDGTVDNS